jgi:TniQ protein/Tn7-like transposition protein D
MATEPVAPGFPFFPIPAEGESVYSVFCRCSERSGLPDQYILSALTGQPHKTTLLGALPGRLQMIASALPSGHPWTDPANAIQHHTSLPYFTYFDSPRRRKSATKLLITNTRGNDVGLALGLTQYRCGAVPKHPRFCSVCTTEDERNLGFSYFHIEHQLPGVAVCWKHGVILSHGCRRCGTYPIPGRGLSMPGRCKCQGGPEPLPAFETLPQRHATLRWLAAESAKLVGSTGTGSENPRAALRQLAINSGLGRGTLPAYSKVAAGLEQKYGADTLDWLGTPAWTSGRPSAWIRRLLQVQPTDTRKSPTILFLLFVGLFYDTVLEFEAAVRDDQPGSPTEAGFAVGPASILPPSRQEKKGTIVTPKWARSLPEILAKHSFHLSVAAAAAGVSTYTVAAEARRQGIRVPLRSQTRKKLGKHKLDRIRAALGKGVPKKNLERTYGISEWAVLLIELDKPGVAADHRALRAIAIRHAHRRKVLDLIARDQSASRSTVMTELPGTYDYVINQDKAWFGLLFPQRKKPANETERKPRLDRPTRDKALAFRVQELIAQSLAAGNKPERITKCGVLKRTGHLAKYLANPDAFPETTSLLDKLSESQFNYINRKITWAIEQLQESGQAISVNTLRRKAAVHPSKVRERREFVIKVAEEKEAEINRRSFFAEIATT